MRVGIDEAGQQRPVAEIDHLCARASIRFDLLPADQAENAISLDCDAVGIGSRIGVHRDHAAAENNYISRMVCCLWN
jgi:hypothetical protein